VSDEVRTVLMDGSPRERGMPEDDADRNNPKAERWWWPVADVDLRVHPVPPPRPFVANRPGCVAAGTSGRARDRTWVFPPVEVLALPTSLGADCESRGDR
jgi:hypothetical protein